jgi:hypothetical protein
MLRYLSHQHCRTRRTSRKNLCWCVSADAHIRADAQTCSDQCSDQFTDAQISTDDQINVCGCVCVWVWVCVVYVGVCFCVCVCGYTCVVCVCRCGVKHSPRFARYANTSDPQRRLEQKSRWCETCYLIVPLIELTWIPAACIRVKSNGSKWRLTLILRSIDFWYVLDARLNQRIQTPGGEVDGTRWHWNSLHCFKNVSVISKERI